MYTTLQVFDFNESIRCLNYMYLHYSLLLIVCNYELVIFVSLFQWYERYICNYISLQFFIYFVIVNLWPINIFRLFLFLILPSSKLKSLFCHYLKSIILLAGFTFPTSFEEERESSTCLLWKLLRKHCLGLNWRIFDFLKPFF